MLIQVGHAADPAKMFMVTGDQLATALGVACKPSLGWIADGAQCIDLDHFECHHPGTEDRWQCKQCLGDFERRLLNRSIFIPPGSVLAVGPWVMQIMTAKSDLAECTQRELMKLCN